MSSPTRQRWGKLAVMHDGRHHAKNSVRLHRSTHLPLRPFTVRGRPLTRRTRRKTSSRFRPSGTASLATIDQLQARHHADLGEGVQRAPLGTVQLDAPGRGSQQHGDNTILTGATTHRAPVTIHNHVGSLSLVISSPRKVDRCTDNLRNRIASTASPPLGDVVGSADPADRGDVTPRDPGDFDDVATLRRINVEAVTDVDADVTDGPVQRDEVTGQ